MSKTPLDEALDRLHERLGRISIEEFHAEVSALLDLDRTEEELTDWRLRRRRLKKVCDEVIPVDRFLRYRNITQGELSFPLDSNVPDCFWYRDSNTAPIGIEVTVAQGRARHILATELIENDVSRGFLDLRDDANREEAAKAANSQRIMYRTETALASVSSGIQRCLREKDHSKYQGMILIIEADFTPLRPVAWNAMLPELTAQARSMPFREIHTIGKGEKLLGYQLK